MKKYQENKDSDKLSVLIKHFQDSLGENQTEREWVHASF